MRNLDLKLGITRKGGSVLPAVEGGSLQFPQSNAQFDTSDYSYVTAGSLTDPIFAADGALIAIVEVPWQKHGVQSTQNDRYCILGNSAAYSQAVGGITAGSFGISVKIPRERTTSTDVRFIGRNSTQTVGATITLSGERKRATRLVLVARINSGTLTFEAFRNGVSVGSVAYDGSTQAFGSLTLNGNGFLIGCGGNNNLTPYTLESLTDNARVAGFDGCVSFVGYYDGAVTSSAGQDISAGVSPETALTAANWRFARELNSIASSYAAADWATGDSEANWTRTGTGIRTGSDLVPARDSTNWLAMTPINDGTVWAVAPAGTTATVELAGTASGVTGTIQARCLTRSGILIQDWTTLTGSTISAGAWQGTMTAPIFSAGWGYIEVRATDAPTMIQRSRAYCGVGYALGIVGQSNAATVFRPDLGSYTAPASLGNVSVLSHVSTSGTDSTLGSTFLDCVTAQRPCSAGLAAAANEWRGYSQAPLCIQIHAEVGTNWQQWLDDGDTGERSWATTEDMLDLVAFSLPTRVTMFAVNWWPNIMAGSTTGAHLDALINGTGTVWNGAVYDHYLRDGLTFTTDFGVIVSPETGFLYLGPSGTDVDRGLDWALEFTDATTPTDVINTETTYYHRQYVASKGAGYHMGVPKNDVLLVGGHTETSTSQARAARRFITEFAIAAGFETQGATPVPTAYGTNGTNEIWIDIDLPDGATALMTEWEWNDESPPEGENAVQGVYVMEPGDAEYRRTGFTAEITDDGSVSGTARVTLTRSTGNWAAGTRVSAWAGWVLNLGSITTTNELHKGIPHATGNSRIEGGLGLMVWGHGGHHARICVPWTPSERTAVHDGSWGNIEAGRVWADSGKTTPATVGGAVAVVEPVDGVAGDFTIGGTGLTLEEDENGVLYLDFGGAAYADLGSGTTFHYPRMTHIAAVTQAQKAVTSGVDLLWTHSAYRSYVALATDGTLTFGHNNATSGNPTEPAGERDGSNNWPFFVVEASLGGTTTPTGYHSLYINGKYSHNVPTGNITYSDSATMKYMADAVNARHMTGRFYGWEIFDDNSLDYHQRWWDRHYWLERVGRDATILPI